MPAEISFYGGERVTIEPSKLQFLGAGGQGRAYKWEYRGKTYLVKTLSDSTVFQRTQHIRKALEGVRADSRVIYRGLPVAQGYADGAELGFTLLKTVYLLIFNYVEGESVEELVTHASYRRYHPLHKVRKGVARQMLEIMATLEAGGVVHSDLYPDNFMVSKKDGRVYLLDLVESAGVWRVHKKNWLWRPRVLGKQGEFLVPPEVKNEQFHVKSDVWVGIGTVMRVLGIHPFGFMIKADLSSVRRLARLCERDGNWPPKLRKFPRWVDRDAYKEFRKLFSQLPQNLRYKLHKLYIQGLDHPDQRPSFREFQEAFKGVW